MSITKLFLAETLFDGFVKTPPTLKEQTLTKVAIELCEDSEMKKHILCTSDPLASNTLRDFDYATMWRNLIKKRSSVMCEIIPLPSALKSQLLNRIWWISVELLSWNKQHQALLRTPPELTYKLLIQSDWTVEGRLDKEKIANRLVRDARIEICPRYQLACINCLELHIRKLWNRLSCQDQADMCGEGNQRLYWKLSALVKIWSNNFAVIADATLEYGCTFWKHVLKLAITEGATTAVVSCWTALSESEKQDIVLETTLSAIPRSIKYSSLSFWMGHLIENCNIQYVRPTDRRDVFFFLFSQMSDEQRDSFFQGKTKELNPYRFSALSDALECLLQWPYQEFFIPLMTRLWGMLSEQNYGNILLRVADYGYNVWDNDYDYKGLLMELLEKAPEKYKLYIFKDKESNVFNDLLYIMCRNLPFLHTDMCIQHVLKQATAEKIQIFIHSSYGTQLFLFLIWSANWELMDCLLSECMTVVDVAKFKEGYVRSMTKMSIYFDLIRKDNEEHFNAFLNFLFSSAEEISQFKYKSIFELQHRFFEYACELKLDFLNKIIRRCLSSDEAQKQYREQYIKTQGMDVCRYFIEKSEWDELEQFIRWCLPSDEEMEMFKWELYGRTETCVEI